MPYRKLHDSHYRMAVQSLHPETLTSQEKQTYRSQRI